MQTISLVLHHRPGVSNATRKRIRAVIERLGYTPAASALALRGAGTQTLGVVYPGTKSGRLSASGYLEEILNGICAAANTLRYHVLLHALSTDANPEQFLAFERQGRVDGIITIVSDLAEPHLVALAQGGLPVVSIQRPSEVGHSVRADNRGGTRLAVSHLYERGHRRIAYLGGNQSTYAGKERLAGFLEGCQAHGLSRNTAYEAELNSSEADTSSAIQQAAQITSQWLNLPQAPSAVVCFSDLFALGVIRGAHAQQKQVPQDIAVVGFNNFALASSIEPPLTTLHFPAYELGKISTEMLVRQLEYPENPKEELVLPIHLVIRAST